MVRIMEPLFAFLLTWSCASRLLAVFPSRWSLFFRVNPTGSYQYLQIAQRVRGGNKVRQQVFATLDRLARLQASGPRD